MKPFYLTLLAGLLLCGGCGPTSPPAGATVYSKIAIDPTTLTVTFQMPIPALPEPRANFYSPFFRADGNCSLDHFDTTISTAPRTRYNAFNLDPQRRITSRTKYQILLNGEFGTFYAETGYHYAPTYNPANTAFRVYAASNQMETEPPQVVDTPLPGQAQLSVISVLRVFSTPTGHTLISACYASDGTLQSLSEGQSTGGDCSHGGTTTFGPNATHAQRFGLPASFPVATYAADPSGLFGPTPALTSVVDCVSHHYDRNRRVRQEIQRTGKPLQKRMLTYRVTPDDTALDPIDQTRKFGLMP